MLEGVEAAAGDTDHPIDPVIGLEQRDEAEPEGAGRARHRHGEAGRGIHDAILLQTSMVSVGAKVPPRSAEVSVPPMGDRTCGGRFQMWWRCSPKAAPRAPCMALRLHALAILYGRTELSLASSGGVHYGTDAAKAVLCGADVVQMVSALLDDGPGQLGRICAELTGWFDNHGYRNLAEARGATALDNVANPHELERLNYAHLLHSWQPRVGQ